MYLEKINKVNDIKKIRPENYDELAREIRHFLVENVSRTGGHLASNLGVVELTMALHLALNIRKDKIVWDVGHQSYVHKILTGRKDSFDTLRCLGGLSGFPKRRESEFDSFNTGHSTTSISVALGMAEAALLKGTDETIVAVIGDGALTGGMAYEALNNVSKLRRNLIIILNDNNMSISENVGGMSSYLSKVRAGGTYNSIKAGVVNTLEVIPVLGDKMVKKIKRTKDSIKKLVVPGAFFEDMGITYLGPVDGHNVRLMRKMITEAKKIDHPVLIHICTKKGRGYGPAEKHPDQFHGVGKFSPKTGRIASKGSLTYTDVFAGSLIKEAEKDNTIVAITAAMADGTGLRRFAEQFPERFFDVGIAEEHAVTFAAGLASSGMKPFVAIYSTFMQRAFDQILHDVCIQSLPVILCLDRAGLVGNDGETHQGTFDLSYLSSMPNMNILAPANDKELQAAVHFAAHFNAPLAIRYPRGIAAHYDGEISPIEFGKSEFIYMEKDIAILSVGTMLKTSEEVRDRLKEQGRSVTLVNVRFVKPCDEEMLRQVAEKHSLIVTIEENVLAGGFGLMVLRLLSDIKPGIRVVNIAIPNMFIEQGTQSEQMRESGLDSESIMARLDLEFSREK